MKIVVLAQTPPPVHGQSLMVQALLEGLPALGISVRHVPLALSRTHGEIGKWRPAKVLASIRAAIAARRLCETEDADALYYVPAPGKRGALWRDIAVLWIARPRARRLVLHWHAAGLGEWLGEKALPGERALAMRALGGADLSIVLAESLRGDADFFEAKSVSVVPNGVADPNPPPRAPGAGGRPWRVLFLGQCSEEKGLFAASEAVLEANRRDPGRRFELVAAGAFARTSEAEAFGELARRNPGVISHAGEVSGESKRRLLCECDCLCMPTRYPHEGQPLVILEALAYDLPVVATRWRAIAETLPASAGLLVPPGDADALAQALVKLRESPGAPGVRRAAYLDRFTVQKHLQRLAEALGGLVLRPEMAGAQPGA